MDVDPALEGTEGDEDYGPSKSVIFAIFVTFDELGAGQGGR